MISGTVMQLKMNLIHVYREGNRATNWLANQAASQLSSSNILDNILLEISRTLE